MTNTEIPYGFCQCGCGQQTKIARQDNPKYGHIKGQPLRFVLNHSKTPATLEEKFWRHVIAGDRNNCWEWQGDTKEGYGKFSYRGKTYAAHRVSYEIHNGKKLLPEEIVCHECDNRPCCNPYHLFEGTHAINALDRDNKNRQAKGSRGGTAKLNEDSVATIRKLYASGILQKDLAAMFDMNQANISGIIRGNSWKHVAGAQPKPKRPKLTREQAEQVRQLANAGTKRVELAQQFGVTYSTIKRIVAGKTHA